MNKLAANPVSLELIEDIHGKTLDLLNRYGIYFEDPIALDFLLTHGAVKGGEGRVCFPSRLVEETLKLAPESFFVTARNPEKSFGVGGDYPQAYGPGAGMTTILESQGRRPATLADAHAFLKLAHTSPYCSVSAAGLLYPPELPPLKALHIQLFAALTLSDKPLFGLTQDENYAADSIAMARIASGINSASAEKICMGVVNSLSPLGWAGNMLRALRVFAMENQPLVIAACAMSGATSPVSLAGTLVTSNAEILAGIVYSQLLSPGTPVIYGNTSGIADMATMALSIGAPECTLLAAGSAALARYYHIPCRTGGGLSDSPFMDMQAGAESMLNMLGTVNCGAAFILQCFGVMESFLSLSYEKWLFDEEILDKALRFQKGISPPGSSLVDEIIDAINDESGFLGHETTVKGFKDEFLFPILSARGSAEKHELLAAAGRLCEKRLALYTAPFLPADIEAALKKYTE
ncbi:MAG: trimethylamine methyltransferase family protein [Treponema sp.]|jgi:trimethylamine--corrinoid protein Co-methyltransferase|nr:trimethylamine methyltransferase family protein [Treponema sp.]